MDTQNDAMFETEDTFSKAHLFWYLFVKFPGCTCVLNASFFIASVTLPYCHCRFVQRVLCFAWTGEPMAKCPQHFEIYVTWINQTFFGKSPCK